MKPNQIVKGDAVVFAASVVKRCGYSKDVANDIGVVNRVDGAVAQVQFNLRGETWVPMANLSRTKRGSLGFTGVA
jgi:hypothetical protein